MSTFKPDPEAMAAARAAFVKTPSDNDWSPKLDAAVEAYCRVIQPKVHALVDTAEAKVVQAIVGVLDFIGECGKQFRHYEQQHLAKGTPEGDEKAAVNARFAERCEAIVGRDPT